MHVDPLGILGYRIRKLEVILELIADAERCKSVYVKAGVSRGIMERVLEDDLADASPPALLLAVSRHHHQDLKFLRRSEANNEHPAVLATIRANIAGTIKLKEDSAKRAADLASAYPMDSEAVRIYEGLKKRDTVEERARLIYPTVSYARFYADYSALSQFVHGGNRETLMVTTSRGDLTETILPIANQLLAAFKELVEDRLAVLRGLPQQAPEPQRIAPIGYDTQLEFRRIAIDNWLQPDLPGYIPGLRAGEWITAVLDPKLGPHVPLEIVRLFEVCRGTTVYAWYFYPLLTLAAEQSHRVMEAAAKLRSEQIGHPEETFARSIKRLMDSGILDDETAKRWEATRGLRNSGSHPKRQQIWDAGSALDILKSSAELINRLFENKEASNP
jgi:hypothetical protein